MNANDKQVGGNHYRTPSQHWDMAARMDLGYFEGQITKYITRHRFKKGEEDAKKALHFTDKLIELVQKTGKQPRHKFITSEGMSDYVNANQLNVHEYSILFRILNWSTINDLLAVKQFIEMLIDRDYGGPTPAYVNQDGGS